MSSWLSGSHPPIGVGLRHPHYHDALNYSDHGATTPIDFIEVHAENFFAEGGATLAMLDSIGEQFPISIHGTAMGLGSAVGIPDHHLDAFAKLIARVNPVLVSEHAAFTWSHNLDVVCHAGDLLPVAFNPQTLSIMADNISRVQDRLKRQILIENLSAYLTPEGSVCSETAFLSALVDKTGCQLLVDINNLAVNHFNSHSDSVLTTQDIVHAITTWLADIPTDAVGEIHLAGCTPVPAGELMVDDHSCEVSDAVWQGYHKALELYGPVPTLIEWDSSLPPWRTLIQEAEKARTVAERIFSLNSNYPSVEPGS